MRKYSTEAQFTFNNLQFSFFRTTGIGVHTLNAIIHITMNTHFQYKKNKLLCLNTLNLNTDNTKNLTNWQYVKKVCNCDVYLFLELFPGIKHFNDTYRT